MRLTTKQYKDAIQKGKALSSRQIEILQLIYYCPNSSATAKQLTKLISPTSDKIIIANAAVGKIGRALSDYIGKLPSIYNDGHKDVPSFYLLVGPYTENGWQMTKNLQKALEELELVSRDDIDNKISSRLPTETLSFDEVEYFKEGKVIQIYVDKFERNQKARLKCIEHYGDKCYVCGFDFGQVYGDIAQGFIHVHHLKQLSEIKSEYQVDPINDLIPVCANCHSVIHLTRPSMTIKEIKKKLKKSSLE